MAATGKGAFCKKSSDGLCQVLNYNWDEGQCFGKQAISFAPGGQGVPWQAGG